MVSLEVTIGVEVDEEEARNVAKECLGDEYEDDMSAEECAEVWADNKFNRGLGCFVRIL